MEDYKYVMGELSAIRSLQQDLKETLQMDDIDGWQSRRKNTIWKT